MKKTTASLLAIVLVLLALFMLSACAGSAGTAGEGSSNPDPAEVTKPANESHDPVQLSIFLSGGITDEEYQRLFAEPTAKKFPYMTLKRVTGNIDDKIAAGEIPDILGYNPWGKLYLLQDWGLLYDLNPLIKKYNMDLSHFDPDIVKWIQALGPKGEFYAIPHRINSYAFYYNKDIFDKFGVNYPTNGMNWQQVIELAKKVSRNENGVQYRGLDFNLAQNLGSPYSFEFVDPKTNKAIIADKWKDVFELAKTIYDIPNNKPAKTANSQKVVADPNSHLAMTPGYTESLFALLDAQRSNGMKWGVVQYPAFRDLPDTNRQLVAESLFISAQSKHKEEAFQLIQWLVSDEVQLENVRNATVSPLKDKKFQEQYGKNIPELQGQDLSGLFAGKYATPPASNPVVQDYYSAIDRAWDDVMTGKSDINTALRQAGDKVNQVISDKLNQ